MNHAAEEEPVPASPQALARLDRFKADDDLKGLYGLANVFGIFSDEACPICLFNYVIGENCMKTPCNHIYHSKCLMDWFQDVRFHLSFSKFNSMFSTTHVQSVDTLTRRDVLNIS
jgi:hypothetical protein